MSSASNSARNAASVSRPASGSPAHSRRDSVEQSFEDSLASLTPALQLLMEDPAGVLPREMATFRHHVVVYRDTIQPLDTSEWLSVIRCAIAATDADRYRRADAALIDEKSAVVLRSLVGSKALAPSDATPQEKERVLQQADKTNDDLVRRWRQGDREATATLQKLLAGVITVPEIMARTLNAVMESHSALTSLASRAEASINRSLRDIHWRRNLMRLADNSGFGQARDTGQNDNAPSDATAAGRPGSSVAGEAGGAPGADVGPGAEAGRGADARTGADAGPDAGVALEAGAAPGTGHARGGGDGR